MKGVMQKLEVDHAFSGNSKANSHFTLECPNLLLMFGLKYYVFLILRSEDSIMYES